MTPKLGTKAFIDTVGELVRCPDDALTDPETSAKCLQVARSIPKPAAAPEPVVTAEFDPLRDEGGAYATRLRDSGVPVAHFG
jgi:acetyl esterase/lipase